MSEQWHIKKELTWGHIVTTFGLIVTAALAWGDINSEIRVIKVKQEAQEERDKTQDKRLEEQKRETEKKLDKIDENVEKIVDHLLKEGHKSHR